MKYLLTFDFDVIMFPNIWNYDNDDYHVGDDTWVKDLEKDHSDIAATIANLNNYQKLTKYILFLCKNGYTDRIHFIDEHKDVLKYVDKNYEWECENIDSHADTVSGDFGSRAIPDALNNGNWVYFFFKDYNLKKYTYIDGGKSEKREMLNISPYMDQYEMYIQGFDTYKFDENKIPDVLVLCASYPWVTSQFHPLFQVWKDIVNNYKVD